MKRILSLLLVIFCIPGFSLSFSAFTTQSSGVCQCADDTGAYAVRFSGKRADITRYASRSYDYWVEVSDTICAACAYRGKVVLFCPDYNNNRLIVYVYYMDDDVLDSFGVSGAKLLNGTDFACDDTAIYLENYRDNSELLAYSYSGAPLDRYRFDYEITALCGGYHSGMAAVSGESLYQLEANGFSKVGGASVCAPLFSAESDVLVSACGQAYLLDGKRITDTFSVDTDHHAWSACVIGDTLYYPCGDTVYGYELDSGEKTCYYRTNGAAKLLYADSNCVTAVGDSLYINIGRDDFTRLNLTDHSSASASGNIVSGSGNPNPSARGSSAGAASGISSDVYHIDWERYCIDGIPPGTSAAAFLSHMRYSGYTASLYRDGALKKSGNTGTAMTAVFESDNESVAFELAVDGDLTGEGNRNARDLNVLLDYLIGSTDFNGVYEIAADLSGDGTVDVTDAALLKRKIG